ncbi:hypothetical protein JCM24511_05297 [Saitozyma sp. JCM 24511]|nr:hypothetical protein JCM24511_05297 [Saitozyma sp. JCM 24511]
MPGFACEWPDCHKTYKKAADLERHERLHTGELKYTCKVCGKRYARSDVLTRHLVQIHGEPPPTIGRPRKLACVPCDKIWMKCDGVASNPCSRCLDKQQLCQARHLHKQRTRNGAPQHKLGRGVSTLRSSATPKTGTAGRLEMSLPSNSVGPVTERITTIRLAEQHQNVCMPWASLEYAPTQPLAGPPTDPLPNNEVFMLTSMAPQDDDPLAFLNLDIHMPSVHNWGSGDQNFNRWFGSCGVDSSVPSRVGQDVEKGRLDPGTGRSGMDNPYGQPQEIPDVESDDSPWPHIYKLKDKDIGVSLASLSTPLAAAALVPAENDILGTSRGTMAAIAQDSSWAIWPSVDIGNLPSVQAVTTPANLYNQYLHNLLLSYPDYGHRLASPTAVSCYPRP